MWLLNRDTGTYWHLANIVYRYGRYTLGDAGSRYKALLRPPVYPVVLAAAVAAGLLFGAAALTKPAMTFWPVALVPVWWLVARGMGGRPRWGRLAACVLVQSSFMLAWAARNHAAEGTFVFSAIPAQNVRMMVVPRMDVWLDDGQRPTPKRVARHARRTVKRLNRFLDDPANTPAGFVDLQRSEAVAAVAAHPWLAFQRLRPQRPGAARRPVGRLRPPAPHGRARRDARPVGATVVRRCPSPSPSLRRSRRGGRGSSCRRPR